jgi:hypothetical protein
MRLIVMCLIFSTGSSCVFAGFGAVTAGLAFQGEADRYARGAAREANERVIAARNAEVLRARYRASEAAAAQTPAEVAQMLSAPPLVPAERPRQPLRPSGAR